MVAVRRIGRSERPPLRFDHVVVERTSAGTVRVTGRSKYDDGGVCLSVPQFAEMEEALKAALDWAASHEIAVVYVIDMAH